MKYYKPNFTLQKLQQMKKVHQIKEVLHKEE